MRPGHFDSEHATPVQVSFAATPNLFPSASMHPTMSPDGCTRASETPAKAPNKRVFERPKHRRIRTRACDFGLVPQARGEAVTNTSARSALRDNQVSNAGKRRIGYGRRARSDEHPAGFALSRRFTRYSLQVRLRRAYPRLQTRQSLEVQEKPPRHLDGSPEPQLRGLASAQAGTV